MTPAVRSNCERVDRDRLDNRPTRPASLPPSEGESLAPPASMLTPPHPGSRIAGSPGTISAVGILVTYFAAPSDAVAAGLVATGPTVKHAVSKALQKAYRANDRTATRLMYKANVDLADEGVYALDVKVMPATELVTLEALLTGGLRRTRGRRGPRIHRRSARRTFPHRAGTRGTPLLLAEPVAEAMVNPSAEPTGCGRASLAADTASPSSTA